LESRSKAFFADDDNAYDARLFEEIAKVGKKGMDEAENWNFVSLVPHPSILQSLVFRCEIVCVDG